MYRALTYAALQKGISCDNDEGLSNLAEETKIELGPIINGSQQVICNKEDVTEAIREPSVSQSVSEVSKHKSVREALVKKQQELAADRDVVMDGRDIGTVVLPDAEIKIFLTAELEERAKRRYRENVDKGYTGEFSEVKREIEKRDLIDKKRAVGPLRPAPDAVVIDTTGLSREEVTEAIMGIYREKRGEKDDSI